MVAFIFSIILLLVAIAALAVGVNRRKFAKAEEADGRPRGAAPIKTFGTISLIAGAVFGAVAAFLFLTSILFTQSVGQARVIVNVDGTVAGTKLNPGWGVKAPWQSLVDFDLFAQQATYAGNAEGGSPSYTGGEVNGYEITTAVARGAQANFDLSVTYSLEVDEDQLLSIYEDFRTQERFTSQIVNQQILSITRDVPSAYTPVEFRGDKRGEATTAMLDGLNESLNKYGVNVSVVNIQDIRYTEQVEESIKAVEVAQQNEEKAQADLRAAEVSSQTQIVEAEAAAEAERARAQGVADANRTITESLTDEVLAQRLIEAYGEGTVFVVPEDSSPLVQVQQQKAAE